MITDESVQGVVRKIAEKIKPQMVVAFGSWVEGRAGKDSDLDLLVIMPLQKWESRLLKSGDVRNAVHDSPFPMDILVRSPEDIENDFFIRDIAHNGRILYST